MKLGIGTPETEGVYCAEVYHGWRVLEWREGHWTYDGGWAHWQAGEPVQWVGPLPQRLGTSEPPKIIGQDTQWSAEQIERAKAENAETFPIPKLPPMEFDL